MYKILKIRRLAPNVREYVVHAPDAARHARAGQFVILRVDENGERVPFTICDYDRENGTVTVLVQEVGYTTELMGKLNEGDCLQDFVGPLGKPTDLSAYKNIALIGGGIGTAVIYPQAKQLKKEGRAADVIVGARNKELIMYEREFSAAARELYLTTDDGSYVRKGFVTDVLKELLPVKKYDCVFAVGPMPMMKAVCNVTKDAGVHTVVSMNLIMVDGTGMCGGCRVTVGGKRKYACVDGPEFDGHLIDWDEAISRLGTYKEQEAECRLRGNKGV